MKKMLVLLMVFALAGTASAGLVLRNGDMEGGMFSWYIHAGTNQVVTEDLAYGGSQVMEVQGTAGAASILQNAWYYPVTDFNEGDEYFLKADVRRVSGTNTWADCQMVLRCLGSSGTVLLDQTMAHSASLPDNNWLAIESPLMTVPVGTDHMDVVIYSNLAALADPALYHIDNVAVVPEPATMALLGIGALALIRRKK